MDPLSMTASIGSVCVIAVKLISSLSDFIDNARSASAEVQSLTNELASLYSCLGHVKLAIQQPRHANGVSESWKKDLDKLLKDCIETLGLLQDVVAKAKVVETRASGQQLWKSIKFVFKTKTIEVLRRRIVLQNGVLTNLLSLLLDEQSGRIQEKLDSVHDMVADLVSSQRNVKEVLVVLDSNDSRQDQADFILQDRTSRDPSRMHSPQINQNAKDLRQTNTPSWMESTIGQAALMKTSQTEQPVHILSNSLNKTMSRLGCIQALNAIIQQERGSIENIASRKWPVVQVKLSTNHPRAEFYLLDSPLSQSDLSACLVIDRVLYLTIVSANGNIVQVNDIPVKLYTFVGELSTTGRVLSLNASTCWKDVVPSKAVELVDNCVLKPGFYDLAVTLESEEQAKDLYKSLQVASKVVEDSWELHAVAFSSLVSDLKTDQARDLQDSAILEMCRLKWLSRDLL